MHAVDRATKSSRHAGSFSAIDPENGKTIEVYITHQRLGLIQSRGNLAVLELAHIVPDVLIKPTAIFEGMRWEADDTRDSDGWLCYAKRPLISYRYRGNDPEAYQAEAWENETFLVFVNRERVTYNWRWENADAYDSGLPVGHEERFVKRVL